MISLSFIEMENSISQILNTATLLLAFFASTPTAESFCSEAMPIALSSSGFTLFAQALHRYNLTATTTGLTYFAPPDDALINFSLDATSVRGHVSNAGAFYYDSLLTIPHNTTLPTLRNTTLTVATGAGMVSFNDVLVIAPNLYFDGSCAVHGVDGLLVPPSSTSSSASGADLEFAKARMGSKSLPVSSRRRVSETFKAFVRFIRRANGPTRLEEDEEPGIP